MTENAVARIEVEMLALALAEAVSPQEVLQIEAKVDGIEDYMRRTGLYSTAEIRPVNETRMRARWKLGRLLKEEERGKPFPGSATMSQAETRFRDFLKSLTLNKDRAREAQRIGALPEPELEKAFAETRRLDILNTISGLLTWARPWWYQESRKQKHQAIAGAAGLTLQTLGPFPLIYADPPWKFQVYSESGLDRTPDQHYPTLTCEEIMAFRVAGSLVRDIAHEDAALLLWCTSSNLEGALDVMDAWGFTFKSSAVWVKDKSGLGLVFRNLHEVLLYGTRGAMPGPQYQPPSVFHFPRGRHSAKPAEIRTEIERMYPDFDARTRLELFSRDEQIEGWTLYGFEAGDRAVA